MAVDKDRYKALYEYQKAQFDDEIELHQIVTLHALAGDYLAHQGMRGLQAHHMNQAIYHIMNHSLEMK